MNTGTSMTELRVMCAKVDRREKQLGAALLAKLEDTRICGHCHQEFGQHSHEYHFCPSPLDRGNFFRTGRFSEIRCQATMGRAYHTWQCEKEVVPGTDRCLNHQD